MIDFHSHVLPGVDDGSDSVETSLAMLRESRRQGVDRIFATPHFYADEEDPVSFLIRRDTAYGRLRAAMGREEGLPAVRLGAEILFFPGISEAEELRTLRLEGTALLLIEPPMRPWSESMLDEIELCGKRLRCVPVIAHIDRYIRLLDDPGLFDRVRDRRLLVQINASFFLRDESRALALKSLRAGQFHFLGSDCHDMGQRRPNMGEAAQIIREGGAWQAFSRLNYRQYKLLNRELGR